MRGDALASGLFPHKHCPPGRKAFFRKLFKTICRLFVTGFSEGHKVTMKARLEELVEAGLLLVELTGVALDEGLFFRGTLQRFDVLAEALLVVEDRGAFGFKIGQLYRRRAV